MSVNPKIDPPQRRPAPDAVILRPATPADVDLLKHWDREPHVVAAKGDDDWHWETELGVTRDWREQFIAEVDGRPIGYLEIIDPSREDSQYWGSIADGYRAIDLWIGASDALGRGYGTQIMNQAIARSFADPSVNTILVDPLENNLRAHHFYESLGFEYVVCRRFGDDCCHVYRLRRPGTATRDS